MILDALAAGITRAVETAWAFAIPIPETAPTPVEEPDVADPFRRFVWGYDGDAFERACELQAEWCQTSGWERVKVMKRYHKAVAALYPHAA